MDWLINLHVCFIYPIKTNKTKTKKNSYFENCWLQLTQTVFPFSTKYTTEIDNLVVNTIISGLKGKSPNTYLLFFVSFEKYLDNKYLSSIVTHLKVNVLVNAANLWGQYCGFKFAEHQVVFGKERYFRHGWVVFLT